MTTSKDDALDALFIVEWYATALAEAESSEIAARDEAFAQVARLICKSALAPELNDAVFRVVASVQRCDIVARRALRDEANEARARAARKAVVLLALSVLIVALCLRLETVATTALVCFVALVAPEVASLIAGKFSAKDD